MKFEIKNNMQTRPYNKHWQFCVGSGQAVLALRTDYVRQLKQVHDDLGIKYVRFHGIFDDDMNVVNNLKDVMGLKEGRNILEYNFHRIGVAYDNVLACGMKPFVELSFMPKLFALSDDTCMFYTKFNISAPKSYETWESFIREFIEFLIHRYGKEEIESWYFEVWNEPDLCSFFSGNKEEYYKLYEVTANAIKQVNPKLRVGGPATSGSKWTRSFVTFCKNHNIPVDFISTHQYAGDPIGGIEMTEELEQDNLKFDLSGIFPTQLLDTLPENATLLDGFRTILQDRSEQEMLPRDSFVRHAKYVKETAGELPIIYTEWNANSIFAAYTNDTRKVAAYDVKTALDTETMVDYSSIWCFSDIFDEFHEFPEEFHGGFGMLSNSGIPKPIYYALKEMAKLGDERIIFEKQVCNENDVAPVEMAAFRKGELIQIVLYRMCMQQLEEEKKEIKVTIELDKKPASLKIVRIDENHGNPLKYWEKMGKPRDLNSKEVQEIIEKSKVYEEQLNYNYQNNIATINIEMDVNDVNFITIEM